MHQGNKRDTNSANDHSISKRFAFQTQFWREGLGVIFIGLPQWP